MDVQVNKLLGTDHAPRIRDVEEDLLDGLNTPVG